MFAIKKVCLLAINNTLALLIWRNYFRDFHNISRTFLLRIPLQINRWNTRSFQTIGNFSTRAFFRDNIKHGAFILSHYLNKVIFLYFNKGTKQKS